MNNVLAFRSPLWERTVRGINLLNALCGEISILVAFEVIQRPLQFCDVKPRKIKRASEVTKNELLRKTIATCVHSTLKFRCVLMEIWSGSVENFDFIVEALYRRAQRQSLSCAVGKKGMQIQYFWFDRPLQTKMAARKTIMCSYQFMWCSNWRA